MTKRSLRGLALGIIAVAAAVLAAGCSKPPPKKAAPKPTAAAAKAPAPKAAAPAKPTRPPPPPTPMRSDVWFKSGKLKLYGMLWRPEGPGPFPTFVNNHGAGKDPHGENVGEVFASRGWAHFSPHRRGHGKSEGVHYKERTRDATQDNGRDLVREMEAQADDVSAAIAFMKTQSYVDKNRVVVGGCSDGGMQTIFAAERKQGLRAAIDWAGAAKSWGKSTLIQSRLKKAVRNAQVPIFFIQAANDHSTDPTRELSAEAARAKKVYKSKVYPPHGSSASDGHEFCVKAPQIWSNDVFAFLALHTK